MTTLFTKWDLISNLMMTSRGRNKQLYWYSQRVLVFEGHLYISFMTIQLLSMDQKPEIPPNNTYTAVSTSHETMCLSIANTNRLTTFRQVIPVYCGNQMKFWNKSVGTMQDMLNVKTGETYSNHHFTGWNKPTGTNVDYNSGVSNSGVPWITSQRLPITINRMYDVRPSRHL